MQSHFAVINSPYIFVLSMKLKGLDEMRFSTGLLLALGLVESGSATTGWGIRSFDNLVAFGDR